MTEFDNNGNEIKEDNPWSEYMEHGDGDEGEYKGWAPTIVFFAVLAGLGFLILLGGLKWHYFDTAGGKADLAWAGVLALMVSFFAAKAAASDFFRLLKPALAWAAIFFVVLTAYSFRAELFLVRDRVLSNLLPDRGFSSSEQSMTFLKASDGHFYINAIVNGKPVLFMADTGATSISLTKGDAKKIGLDPEHLTYDGWASTANGEVRTARVRIDSIRVGKASLENMTAHVNPSNQGESLLGMSFFSRMENFNMQDDRLTITWPAE